MNDKIANNDGYQNTHIISFFSPFYALLLAHVKSVVQYIICFDSSNRHYHRKHIKVKHNSNTEKFNYISNLISIEQRERERKKIRMPI
jgi:beta-glucosidase/6-phospho-beta-glucosidase/beta-galactosidase